ncbi:ATPase [Clostridium niameyense]|uniref:ATPase n=1 Tax=Clostridium niameyense TaxID=1622073 RepID=A0A6M0R766_9CLOT|nr:hypothetical protein [Clostridium niameyense]NEZ46025.1 ATPase [Clostridium niameyense]
MDVIKLLEYFNEVIDSASPIPLTGKVAINKKEALEVIEKIINCLPDELKKAKWICGEKERILKDAMEEAENIKRENLILLKSQIENHNITRAATVKAEEIIQNANAEARFMKISARDYADELLSQLDMEIEEKSNAMLNLLQKNSEAFLASLEESIDLKTDVIRENIKELRNMK